MGVPKTLPADFQGWDAAPAVPPPTTLPANFDKWDQLGQGAQPKSWWQQTKDFEAQHGKGMPGAGEGAGLAGGLADWDKASFGEIGGGVKDILSGNVARGLHRIISGGGSMLAPAAVVAAPAAPAATALAIGGGAAGGALASKGAEALGATPDQAALAGDVGSLAGGAGAVRGGGAAINAGKAALATDTAQKLAATAKVLGGSAEELPIVGKFLRAAIKLGDIKEIWHPTLDATGEVPEYAGEKTPPPTAPAQKPPILPDELSAARRAAAPTPPRVSNQLQQYINFRPSIERIIDDAVPPKGETYRDNLIAKAAVDQHLEQGNNAAAQHVLDHLKEAPKAEPAPAESEAPVESPYKNYTPEQWKQFDERLGEIFERVKKETPKQEATPAETPAEGEDLTPLLEQSLRAIQAKKAFVDQNASH